MNIMKAALLCGAFCACVGTAQADFLYWQVTLPVEQDHGTKSNIESGTGAVAEGKTLNTARLIATGKAEGNNDAPTYYQYVTLDGNGNMEDAVAFDLSQLAGTTSDYSFMIELGNATAGNTSSFYTMASGDTLTYGNATSYIGTGGIVAPTASVWSGGAFEIPEPSSGLMLLLGGSLLALRRRRK